MKALLLALFALSLSPNAFADKILNPGEFYTSKRAGERVVCMGDQPQEPESYVFNAEGVSIMNESEMRQNPRCTGVGSQTYTAMLNAKEVASSNCVNVQCPQGYTCAVADGAMQYRPQGQECHAWVPCRATRR